MKILGFGDSIPEGVYRPHSVFRNSVNFRGPAGLVVSLVGRAAGNGPMNIVMERPPAGARRLEIRGSRFHIDENPLETGPGKKYDSSMPKIRSDRARLRRNLALLKKSGGSAVPEKSMWFLYDPRLETTFKSSFELRLLERMKDGFTLLLDGNYARGARALRGLGFGLTPSGDDFLCGCLTGLGFIGANFPSDLSGLIGLLYRSAETENPVSATFAWCAYNGRVNEKVRRLLLALAGTDRTELDASAAAVFRTGHTSGADFCAGLVFGCELGLLTMETPRCS